MQQHLDLYVSNWFETISETTFFFNLLACHSLLILSSTLNIVYFAFFNVVPVF